MYLPTFLLPLALCCTLAIATDTPDPAKNLPTVDLGYGIYRASYYNVHLLHPLLLTHTLTLHCRRATTPTSSRTSASPRLQLVSCASALLNRR